MQDLESFLSLPVLKPSFSSLLLLSGTFFSGPSAWFSIVPPELIPRFTLVAHILLWRLLVAFLIYEAGSLRVVGAQPQG